MGQSPHRLHQTVIMKFVTLALALLLAVGSQAASLQADAPTQLAHARAAFDVYVDQLKASAKKVLDELDGTEYSDLKTTLSQRLDDLHQQLRTLQASVSPVTDSVVSTIADATSGLRSTIVSDFDALAADLEPKRAHLRSVLKKHFDDYYAAISPLLGEYRDRHTAELAALQQKLQPLLDTLPAKVAENVEETKNALIPIADSVSAKLTEHLETLKAAASPYVEEYKEHLKKAYTQAQTISSEDISALTAKLDPLVKDVKTKLSEILEIIVASVNRS